MYRVGMLPGLSPVVPSQALLGQLIEALSLASCEDCKARDGLCSAHKWEVLPQLARPVWVRLMGTASTEQTELQDEPAEPDPDPTPDALRAMRRNARKLRRLAELRIKLAA